MPQKFLRNGKWLTMEQIKDLKKVVNKPKKSKKVEEPKDEE